MAATTGYRVGYEPSDLEFLWYPELVYGQSQDGTGITWNSARLLSENFRGEKTRITPPEIRVDKQTGAYVTTEFNGIGELSTPLVKGTMTEILAAAINADATSGTFTNGTAMKTFSIYKRYAPSLMLEYLGAHPTGFTFNCQTGQFLSLDFTWNTKDEVGRITSLTDPTAPLDTNDIMDPVNSVATLTWDGGALTGCRMVTIQGQKQGAQNMFELGSEAAAGTSQGQLMISGQLSVYFNDFDLYNDFKSETAKAFVITVTDASGGGYTFTLPNARIMNPSIVASGPGPAIEATFNLEATPGGAGHTIEIIDLP